MARKAVVFCFGGALGLGLLAGNPFVFGFLRGEAFAFFAGFAFPFCLCKFIFSGHGQIGNLSYKRRGLFHRNAKSSRTQFQAFEQALVGPFSMVFREIIHILPATNPARNLAIIQPQGNHKDRPLGFLTGNVQDETKFFLNITLFVHGMSGEASHHHVRRFHRLFDLQIPLLPREEVFLVQPNVHPAFGHQLAIQLAHCWLVFFGVAEEYVESTIGHEGSPRDWVGEIIR